MSEPFAELENERYHCPDCKEDNLKFEQMTLCSTCGGFICDTCSDKIGSKTEGGAWDCPICEVTP